MHQKFYKATNDQMFKAIFCKEANIELLECLIENAIKEKVKIKSLMMPEQVKKNIYVKGKTLDILASVNDKEVNIELNVYSEQIFRRRNASYIFNRYINNLDVSSSYYQMKEFIQINLTCPRSEEIPDCDIYKLRGEKHGGLFINNLTIYEFNLTKLVSKLYNGDDEYRFLAMLDLDEKNIDKYTKGDKLMEKFANEVKILNKDKEFISFISDEKEEELIKNTFIEQGIEKGIEQGVKKNKIETARKMLMLNMAISDIAKITGLDINDINKLSEG